MSQNKKLSGNHESVTDRLRKLVTNKIIIEKQKIKKQKSCDDDDYKIQDGTWKDNADEINQDSAGEENDGVDRIDRG